MGTYPDATSSGEESVKSRTYDQVDEEVLHPKKSPPRPCPTIQSIERAMETGSYKRCKGLLGRLNWIVGWLESEGSHGATVRIIEKVLRDAEHGL